MSWFSCFQQVIVLKLFQLFRLAIVMYARRGTGMLPEG